MLTLVRRARRRVLYNELFAQGANAVSAALLGFILLLILGTQVLNWYWAVLLPLAAILAAVYVVRRRLPSLYTTALSVDRRMGLADSLSTAIFFSGDSSRASSEVRRLQWEQAERTAAGIDVKRAVPFAVPRTAYIMAALVLVASSMFALRYGLTRRLDLTQPFARILQQSLGFETREARAKPDGRKSMKGAGSEDTGEQGDAQQDQNQNASANPDDPSNDPLDADAPDQNPAAGKTSAKNSADEQQSVAQKSEGEQEEADGQSPNNENASSDSKQGQKNGENQSAQQNSNGSNNNSSLLSKVKEAMQNLLSSMKQQPSSGNQQQQQQSASSQNSKSGKGQNGSKQQAQKGEKQNAGESDSEDQVGEQANAQSSPGQGKEQGDSPQDKQPGGGIGNRDGSKDVKQAEQLAAMGKITEIIGKRAANLSGEATVEVQSTTQQLRTEYSARRAQHTEAGAEISRDEIPVALEGYVQQYFEQVRKQPAPKK